MRTNLEGRGFEMKVTEVTSNWLTEGTCTSLISCSLPLPHSSSPLTPLRLPPGTIPPAICLPCPPCQATAFAVAAGYSGAAPLIKTLPHYLPPLQQVGETSTPYQLTCTSLVLRLRFTETSNRYIASRTLALWTTVARYMYIAMPSSECACVCTYSEPWAL